MIARKLRIGGLAALALGVAGIAIADGPSYARDENPPAVSQSRHIVALRRLTEAQYRNSIADIFGPDIQPAGRFEPIVRVAHRLIASGASTSAISPTGLEQFEGMARVIAAQVFDERHRSNFVPCKPKNETDSACAAATLTTIGRQVLRRPLTKSELDRYVGMVTVAANRTGSFYEGLELGLAAMLVSPEFLYIIEVAEPDPEHPGAFRLDNYSRASRLSYFLWNSTPDEELLAAAAAGQLSNPGQLRMEAKRLAGSVRLEQGVRAFFADMLMFEKFDGLAKDPIVYPRFNQDVAKALPEQMALTIVDHLVWRRDDYRTLFTTPRTWVSRPLGALYEIPVKRQAGWEPYEFAEGDGRAGLVGQAGFLAMYSQSGRSSPTLRGRAVRELLLCQPVPDPPGNVNFTVVQETTNPVLRTARDRLSAHATDPSCSGCHKITDPIGLSLESFDGMGAHRWTENGVKLNLEGEMGPVKFEGPLGLGRTLANDPALSECAASRTLEYLMGRPVEDEGDMVEAALSAFVASGYKFPDLMVAVATMPQTYQVKSSPLSAPLRVSQAAVRNNSGGIR